MKKIFNIQALRTCAFLGIFLSHANYYFGWPALGVSIFFVMSGYLMYYNHPKLDIDISLINCIKFSWARIKKLYRLHIITMVFAIIFEFVYMIQENIDILSKTGGVVRDVLLNISLTQSWFPDRQVNVSLNGVAWYLSTLFFLYALYPVIHKIIKSIRNKYFVFIFLSIFVIQVLSCLVFILYFGKDNNVYTWFMYCFPIFRIGDFFCGMFLQKISQCDIQSISKCKDLINVNIAELGILIATIVFLVWMRKEEEIFFLQALKNGTTLYIPFAMIWVDLFVKNQGVVTKLLSNDVFIQIGNISAYLYLIHFVVVRLFNMYIYYQDISLDIMGRSFVIVVELMLSILIAKAYKIYVPF